MTTETQVSKCQQHKDCLAVVSAKGALVTSSGTAILTDLPALVTATPSTDGQAVVLGTLSATGPASLFDTAVGKVRLSVAVLLLRLCVICCLPPAQSIPNKLIDIPRCSCDLHMSKGTTLPGSLMHIG